MSDLFGKLLLSLLLFLTWGSTMVAGAPTLDGHSTNPRTPIHLGPGKSVVEAKVSPDGKWLACVVVATPLPVGRRVRFSHLGVPVTGEVYLFSLDGRHSSQITDGQRSDGGFFALQWSPDSSRLAMVSSVGGRLSPWLWDMNRESLKRLTEEWIDYPRSGIAWVGSEKLIWAEVPVDQSLFAWNDDVGTLGSALELLWKQADEGRVTTAGVLDSPESLFYREIPRGQLVEYNVRLGTSRILYKGTAVVSATDGSDPVPVFLLSGMSDLEPKKPFVGSDTGLGIYSLGLVGEGGLRTYDTPGFDVELPRRVGDVPSVIWSPDRSEVVVKGTVRPRDFNGSANPFTISGPFYSDKTFEARRYMVVGGELRELRSKGLDLDVPRENFSTQVWSAAGELAVFSWPHGAGKIRADWWLQDQTGTLRCLTCEVQAAPQALISRKQGGFFGVDDGRLWSFSVNGGAPEDVSTLVQGRALGLEVLPDRRVTFLRIENNHQDSLIPTDRITDHPVGILTPGPDAFLSSYSIKANLGVFVSEWGDRVFLSRDGRPPVELIAASRWEAEKSPTQYEKVRIDYQSAKGVPLVSWLYLPNEKRPAGGYPMITISYPGLVETAGTGSLEPPADGDWQDALLKHGYAILYTSDPIQRERPDILRSLVDNVIPAVDNAIARGLVDADRIGVAGHSGGGYATLGLITQTHRFKAAAALSGISDLTSAYLQLDMFSRYAAIPWPPLSMVLNESPLSSHGFGAPWEAPDLYARNSPITFVGNVDTPVLLVHGDLDTSCQIEQSEEFYLALRRQNKRVRFVRYFGEQHSNVSPANIRDENQRVVEWFDQYLKPGNANPSPEHDSKDLPQ
jgi:fermentation-respiration switch protein FrsA (DUF1100 family)